MFGQSAKDWWLTMALTPGNEGNSALCPPWVVRVSNPTISATVSSPSSDNSTANVWQQQEFINKREINTLLACVKCATMKNSLSSANIVSMGQTAIDRRQLEYNKIMRLHEQVSHTELIPSRD